MAGETVTKMALVKRMEETLRKNQMLAYGSRVLVAFSGGVDSVSLLCALLAIKDAWGLRIAAAHLDHGLRGKASLEDADWAEDFCRSRDVTFFRGYWPGSLEVKPGRSPEEAARKARRLFLEDKLKEWPGDVIALGHHTNDQAETVLIHLLNGAGLRGLGGMWPVRGVYIRPLLEINRRMIEDYVAELGVLPRFDETNEDTAYLRNMLRLRVIPVLEACNPEFAAAAVRMAELARQEDAFLDRLADEALSRLCADCAPGSIQEPPPARDGGKRAGGEGRRLTLRTLAGKAQVAEDGLRISLSGLLALDPVLAQRVLRLWLAKGKTPSGDKAGIERVFRLAQSGRNGSRTYVSGGLAVKREKDALAMERRPDSGHMQDRPEPVQLAEVQIKPGETVVLHDGSVQITAGREGDPAMTDEAFDRFICDWPAHESWPVLRGRRPGDWLSMPYGRKKLKEMFIEKGVPQELRDSLPLLAFGSQVLWVPGVVKASGPLTASPSKPGVERIFFQLEIRLHLKD